MLSTPRANPEPAQMNVVANVRLCRVLVLSKLHTPSVTLQDLAVERPLKDVPAWADSVPQPGTTTFLSFCLSVIRVSESPAFFCGLPTTPTQNPTSQQSAWTLYALPVPLVQYWNDLTVNRKSEPSNSMGRLSNFRLCVFLNAPLPINPLG